MRTKLAIIIVNFNTKIYVISCLSSLFTHYKRELQTGQYEVILVDNASKDESVEEIKRRFPTVKTIQSRTNTGFAKANNKGIGWSRGKYVLLLNPDTLVYPKTLNRLVSYLDTHDDVAIVTPKVILPDGALDDACHRGFPTPWRSVTYFLGLGRLFPYTTLFNGYHLGYQQMDKIHEIDACVGACLLVRRKVGERVHWLDPDYFWYGEDLDLCYKVKQAGFRIMYIPDVTILHYKGVASGIKQHSAHLSPADLETKKKAIASRYAVMRIFYNKHYQQRYPFWIKQLVFFGITLKEKINRLRLGI